MVFAIIVFTLIGLWRFDLALLFFCLAAVTDSLDGWWARRFDQITVFGRIMDPFADKLLICGVFVCLVAIPAMTSDRFFPAYLMLQPWMVIVIIGRELLVTSLRAFVEGAGGDFSSKWIGKLKMVFQCAAIILALLYLCGGAEWNIVSYETSEGVKSATVQDYYMPKAVEQKAEELNIVANSALGKWLDETLGTKVWRKPVFFSMLAALWLTFGITLLSGLDYCIHATRMIRKQRERQRELGFTSGISS
jgi:CDP-diacylglycerol--glycerol-3-phosphate 3-phosphatidyltransferase